MDLYLIVEESPVQVPSGKEFHIGRSEQNDLVLADPYISKQHCSLFFDGKDLTISDLQSSNGTYILLQDRGTDIIRKMESYSVDGAGPLPLALSLGKTDLELAPMDPAREYFDYEEMDEDPAATRVGLVTDPERRRLHSLAGARRSSRGTATVSKASFDHRLQTLQKLWPDGAVLLCRKTLELALKQILDRIEMNEPVTRTDLQGLIYQYRHYFKAPGEIFEKMNSIRQNGNMAAHGASVAPRMAEQTSEYYGIIANFLQHKHRVDPRKLG